MLQRLISLLRDALIVLNTIGLIWLAYQVNLDHQFIEYLAHNAKDSMSLIKDLFEEIYFIWTYMA